jgi:hypothetical protein
MLLLRSCAPLMASVSSDRAYQGHADDPERSAAQRQRDEALGRLVRVRRGVIAGAAALTAGAAALASAAVPGRSLNTHAASRVAGVSVKAKTPSATTSPRMPPLASPSQLGLGASGSGTPQAPTPSAPTPQATTPPAPAPQPPAAPPQAAPSGGGAVVSGGS